MKLNNDIRNLEYGWRGGLSEAYAAFFCFFNNDTNSTTYNKYTRIGTDVLNSIKKNKDIAIPLLEYLSELTDKVSVRKFVIDCITEEKAKKLENKCSEIVKKKWNNIISDFISDLEKKKYEELAKAIKEIYDEHKLEEVNDYLDKNIIQNTTKINEISKSDKINIDEIEKIIKEFKKVIDKYCEDLKIINEIKDFFLQFLVVEIEGQDINGHLYEGNRIECAINILKR